MCDIVTHSVTVRGVTACDSVTVTFAQTAIDILLWTYTFAQTAIDVFLCFIMNSIDIII